MLEQLYLDVKSTTLNTISGLAKKLKLAKDNCNYKDCMDLEYQIELCVKLLFATKIILTKQANGIH